MLSNTNTPSSALPVRALVIYATFVGASWLSASAGNELLLFAWPHLASVPLQQLGTDSAAGTFVLQITGIWFVLTIGRLVAWTRPDWRSWFWAGVVVISSIVVATGLSFGVALLLGWPIAV